MEAIAYLVSNAQQLIKTAENNERLALNDPLKILIAEYPVFINIDHISFAFLIEDDRKIKVLIGQTELILKNEPKVLKKIKKQLNKIAKNK